MWTFRPPERLVGAMVEVWSTRASEVLEEGLDVVEIEDSWEPEKVEVGDSWGLRCNKKVQKWRVLTLGVVA